MLALSRARRWCASLPVHVSVSADEPDRAKPGRHAQMAAPSVLVLPAGHVVHDVEPLLLYVPAKQAV